MAAQALIGWKLATGVYLAEDRLVITQVTRTPLGVKGGETVEEPLEGGLPAALARLREHGQLKGAVVCGLDARRDFSITSRLSPGDSQRRPAELLASRLGLSEDALVAARETVRLPGGACSLLTACPRPVASQLLAGLGAGGRAAGLRLATVALALHERALALRPRPRRVRSEIRVLPGEGAWMALLSCHGALVASRLFGAAGESDSAAVRLAVMSLATHAHEELGLGAIEGVVLHTGEAGAALAKDCEAGYRLPTQVAPRLSTDPESASFALACLGTLSRPGATDLFAGLRPPPGLRQSFPIKAAGLLLVAIAGAAGLLLHETGKLEAENEKLAKLAHKYAKKAKVNPKELVKVHQAMSAEFGIASAFITSRVFWSDVLREVPAVVPATGTIVDLDGRDLVKFPAAKKKSDAAAPGVSRQLMLSIEVPLDEADTSPPEVAQLTTALETSPYFHKQFPRITGSNVRLLPAIKGLAARIIVLCFPQARA